MVVGQYVDLFSSGVNYETYLNSALTSPCLGVYTNYTNLYGYLMVDWLNYADTSNGGYSASVREGAFGHVATATAWSGAGGSTITADEFWVAYKSISGTITDLSSTIYASGTAFPSAANDFIALGYPDPFREDRPDRHCGRIELGVCRGVSDRRRFPTVTQRPGRL